eukprot:9423631-Alexandrium_andersonii.AAC.1
MKPTAGRIGGELSGLSCWTKARTSLMPPGIGQFPSSTRLRKTYEGILAHVAASALGGIGSYQFGFTPGRQAQEL